MQFPPKGWMAIFLAAPPGDDALHLQVLLLPALLLLLGALGAPSGGQWVLLLLLQLGLGQAQLALQLAHQPLQLCHLPLILHQTHAQHLQSGTGPPLQWGCSHRGHSCIVCKFWKLFILIPPQLIATTSLAKAFSRTPKISTTWASQFFRNLAYDAASVTGN